MRIRPTLLLPLFLAAGGLSAGLSGCAVVAGTAAGVVLAQEAMDNSTYVVQLQLPADVVWDEVKVSFSKQATGVLDTDDALKVAKGSVDGRRVTVSVESFDQRSSRVIVAAKHYGMADGEMADQVASKIVKDVQTEHDQN